MTTIAYRAGVLACDTNATIARSRVGSIVKIVRAPNGDLAGAAGNAAYNYAFLDWVRNGAEGKPPEAKVTDNYLDRGVIFRKNGEIWIYEPDGRFLISAPYYAFGSGMDIALGAMFMGASAQRAINAAIAHDDGTGGKVYAIRH